jgi:hypothetical protein
LRLGELPFGRRRRRLRRRIEKRTLGQDWGQSVEVYREGGNGCDSGLRIALRAGLSCVVCRRWAVCVLDVVCCCC